MSTSRTFCGIHNSWLIYFIGVASVLESLAFMVALAQVIADVQSEKIQRDSAPQFFIRVEAISGIIIIVNGVRFTIAFALLMARYHTKNLGTLIFFTISTALGIIANIVTGVLAMHYTATYDIGVAHVSVMAIHLLYIIVVAKIIKHERAIALATPPAPNGPIGHVPNAAPLQATVSVVSAESQEAQQSTELQSMSSRDHLGSPSREENIEPSNENIEKKLKEEKDQITSNVTNEDEAELVTPGI